MIINLNKNLGYQIYEDQGDKVVVDLSSGGVINRISIDIESGQKTLLKKIIADECITLYNGCVLKRIQQNLSIE